VPEKIVVTGIGIITAIGVSVDETLFSLQHSRSGMGKVSLFETLHRETPVCEVKKSRDELLDFLQINHDRNCYTRTALLGMHAAREAVASAGLDKGNLGKTGLVSATTTGGMDFNEVIYYQLLTDKRYKEYVELLDCADSTQKIAADLGLREQVTTVSTACSSSANAIIVGTRMIRNGLVDRVLAGGTDALTRFTLNGFNSLEILSPTGCRPFDAERNGVTLGEGAAYLVLESERTANPDTILCELSGYANVNEAYHQTASSPDGTGAVMSIRQALTTAGLSAQSIDYINAHGTGTIINDLSEGKAIETVFDNAIPPVSSTKGFTGHTLAAAGSVEAIISVLSLRTQQLFPNIRFENPMPELRFSPLNQLNSSNPVHHVLSNSFGFGGNNASLIFSSI